MPKKSSLSKKAPKPEIPEEERALPKHFISEGGTPTLEALAEGAEPEIPMKKMTFRMPLEIWEGVEKDRKSKYIKVSKNKWFMDAVMKKLKMKDQ